MGRPEPDGAAVRAAVAQSSRSSSESGGDLPTDELSLRELRDAMWLALELSGLEPVTSPDGTSWSHPPPEPAEAPAPPPWDGTAGDADRDREPERERSNSSRLRE